LCTHNICTCTVALLNDQWLGVDIMWHHDQRVEVARVWTSAMVKK
jgi:hypothetical protein